MYNLLELYIDKDLAMRTLKSIGDEVRGLFNKTRVKIILFNQPWTPITTKLSRDTALSEEFKARLRSNIPCATGSSKGILYMTYIRIDYIDYNCIIELKDDTRTTIDKVIEDIIDKLRNIDEYSEVFSKEPWILVIVPQPEITAYIEKNSTQNNNKTITTLDITIITILITILIVLKILEQRMKSK